MAKKKTHEEFVKEVYDLVGDEYTVLGEYVNSKTKILMKHNICNYEWMVNPCDFLSGKRCFKCYGKRRKTTEEFQNELDSKKYGEYTLLGEYIDYYTKILVRHNCDKCNNYEWEVSPNSLLKNMGCPKCAGTIKKTTEDFKNEVKELVGDEYTVLGEYKNGKTKILIRHNCEECNNYEYYVTPLHFLNNRRCPRCKRPNYYRDNEQFKKELTKVLGGRYELLEEYKGIDSKIKIKHNCDDGKTYIWKTSAYVLLKGHGCPRCSYILRGNMQRKTHDEFVSELYNIHGDEYTLLGEYAGEKMKIRIRHNCDECGRHEWEANPRPLLNGHGCPVCSESKGEKIIRSYLKNKKYVFESQYEFKDLIGLGGGTLKFDFVLFNTVEYIAIEYDGKQHFEPIEYFGGKKRFEYQKMHDQMKDDYCKKNNIKLIRIPYTEFDNIEKILDKELNDV